MGNTASNLVILIPAAGASSRMRGRDKLLEIVDDQPLIARQTGIALATGRPVLVTLPPEAEARRAALGPLACPQLTITEVPDAAEGLAASIRSGALWAETRAAEGLLVMLADLPELGEGDIMKVVEAFEFDRDTILMATDEDGKNGHPVVFPKPLFRQLSHLNGDQGARAIVKAEPIKTIALPGHRATTDLDTPESWQLWRQKTGR